MSENDTSENDNLGNEVTFSQVIQKAHEAYLKLHKQSVKTPAAVKIRDEVGNDLCDIVDLLKALRNTFSDTAPTSLKAIVQQLKELNASTKELTATTKEATTAKSYAQVTAATPVPSPKAQKQMQTRQQRTKILQERAKYEVSLTAAAAPESTRNSLTTMTPKDITERLQRTIDTNIHHEDKPTVFGISKSKTAPDKIRLRCKTEEQAKQLRQINWETAFEGLSVRKPKYGIVIHAVPKDEFNTLIDTTNEATVERIERENSTPIVNIAPLRRKDNENSANASIVAFTTDPYAADRCIRHGFYLNYTHYPAEKYTPDLQITQCYNCGEHGHRAAECHKDKQRCGKCAEHSHPTKECKSDSKPKCGNCEGEHEVWYHKCPVRIAESRRLHTLRGKTSPYFTS